jgi:hypothetical protein
MRVSRFVKQALAFAIGVNAASFGLHAAAIDLSIINPNRIDSPGSSNLFQGMITNNTGVSLNSTDLFLNFAGFDPLRVTLTQILGSTNFTLPDGVTSPLVDLFRFDLSSSASVPATFPAQVVLEAVTNDIAPTQTVSVSTAVPEPSSLGLAFLGAIALLACTLRRRARVLLSITAVLAIAPGVMRAQVSAVQFVTAKPGIAQIGSTLMIALPVVNNGTLTATNVIVTGATLRTAPLISPATFPVALGTIAPAATATFEASFNASSLSLNTSYLLTVNGTYQVGGATAGFALNRFIVLPAPGPGSEILQITTVSPQTVSGAPFPTQPLNFPDDANESAPPVPTGPFVSGLASAGTQSMQVPSASGGIIPFGIQPLAAVTFNRNSGLGLTSGNFNGQASTTAEPSGASNGGGAVFASANWTAAFSVNGGTTFTQLDPTKIFPPDAVGYCCDQIVQYVPSIDRFIWLLQGNGFRLASASPQQVINNNGTAWTYWNLTPGVFGPRGSNFDYPDLSVGNNFLYISWDAACSPNCAGGLQVARISLAQIQAGGTIGIGYTNQSNSSQAWGSHLVQNTGDEIFWAGHNGNSQLRVWSLAEGSNTYFWRDVGISSWANNAPMSFTPDGQDWLAKNFNGPGGNSFPRNGVIGAARSGNQLWFAWTAGTDNFFQQPHVEIVTLNRANNFSKIQQVQIWNNAYAFAYPSFSTNACTGEIGMSLEYGGNGNYENHVVGFWGDFIVYITSGSNVGTNRFGDYVTIRQSNDPHLNGAFFDAFGYGLNSVPPPGTGTRTDVRYVVFGRGGACSPQ